jgi:hypothetical protein
MTRARGLSPVVQAHAIFRPRFLDSRGRKARTPEDLTVE